MAAADGRVLKFNAKIKEVKRRSCDCKICPVTHASSVSRAGACISTTLSFHPNYRLLAVYNFTVIVAHFFFVVFVVVLFCFVFFSFIFVFLEGII